VTRILVTGGAGFLGGHLVSALLHAGHEVTILDDLSTGTLVGLEALLEDRKLKFIQGDVVDQIELEVDQIYNLACPASPPAYQRDPVKTTMTSVLGMKNVLDLAARVGARVLQASTSEVYGDPLVHPQSEDYRGNVNPIGIRACYDEGKRLAESLCFDYWRLGRVDVRVVRIFNTYGPRMQIDDGRVISNFVVSAIKGRALPVHGSGQQTRSFCYVDDMVRAMVAAMNETSEPGPYNVGNPREFTLMELVELLEQVSGRRLDVRHLPLPQDDPVRRCPDISRFSAATGWRPRVELADGLALTMEHFERELESL
jgi:UDP-glucuronate decarboxylase